MGICQSCDATAEAIPAAAVTAKVVLEDGKLEEYSRPVKASHVLHKAPACFVCDSDDMELGDFLSALAADDELHPGQLYFLLPLPMLRRRLQPDDMAALAVRASSALVNSCRCPVWLPAGSRPTSATTRVAAAPRKRERRRGGATGRSFASSLSSIPEWDPDPS
ncbi:hypothetical protein J5N97_024601 [Dioscorea zingiberensis]|uniref:Uncharacterized protein n=1 Tax=Dioscorea zingiberensis TaxID=325984 RepID=A0A9D5H8X2_9LILI|nr:hypothetical protein J5N97_024601 [Dioscorea zingiberensis]